MKHLKGSIVFLAALLLLLPPGSTVAQETVEPQAQSAPRQSRYAVIVQGGQYTMDPVLDRVLEKHPSIKGRNLNVAIQFFGSKGPDRILRPVLALDYAQAKGSGTWQGEPGDKEEFGSLDYTLISLTGTLVWHLFPTRAVNPYLGLGIGVGRLEGEASSETEKISASAPIPVLHIPVGVNVKFTDKIWAHAEAGFRMGVYYAGGVKVLW